MSRTLTTTEIAQLGGDEQAYVLVEQARLRCEQFHRNAGTDAERFALEQIHRELGMAGWMVSSTLDSMRRRSLLAAAHRQAKSPALHRLDVHALAAIVIEGEDAVVAALTRDAGSDHMHLAHLHLLCAMELLAALL
jgi:Tfp pilus assembly protein PilW